MRKFMEKCEKDSKLTLTFFQDFDFIKEVSKAIRLTLKLYLFLKMIKLF